MDINEQIAQSAVQDLKEMWGGNLLRVWREVEKVAAEIQGG